MHVQLMKDDVIDGVAAIDDALLGPPKYFRGEANTILPLLQPCAQRSSQSSSNQYAALPVWASDMLHINRC